MSCLSGATTRRHNIVRDELFSLAKACGFNVRREVSLPGGLRPADLLLSEGGHGGRPLAIDVSVVHPAADDISLKCILEIEKRKMMRYHGLCAAHGWEFAPFVLTSYGAFGASALRVLEGWVERSPAVATLSVFFRRPSPVLQRGCVSLALARWLARQLLTSYGVQQLPEVPED